MRLSRGYDETLLDFSPSSRLAMRALVKYGHHNHYRVRKRGLDCSDTRIRNHRWHTSPFFLKRIQPSSEHYQCNRGDKNDVEILYHVA
jgi:hypothetical protein